MRKCRLYNRRSSHHPPVHKKNLSTTTPLTTWTTAPATTTTTTQTTTIPKPTTTTTRVPASTCDGTYTKFCGCDRGTCYKFDVIPAKANALWCWTQKLGTSQPKANYQQCSKHTECDEAMTCGSEDRFTGAGKPIVHPAPETVCDGSDARGCGCDRGTCYKGQLPQVQLRDAIPGLESKPWCWTQKLGTAEGKGNYQPCSEHYQCNTAMTCGIPKDDYKSKGTGEPIVHPDPQTVCDGTYAKGCGCDRGTCYKFDTIPGKPDAPWCWTQALGTAPLEGQYQKCTDYFECRTGMTCGGTEHYTGSGKAIVNTTTTVTATSTITPSTTTTTPSTTTTSDPMANVCDGSWTKGCGCNQGTCYQFDEVPAPTFGKWCWTQKLATPALKENYAQCSKHTDCHTQMTCGSTDRSTGEGIAIVHPKPETISDNSDARGCGCKSGTCYKYNVIPAKPAAPWCWTQKLGTTELKENYKACSEAYHCNTEMTCGSQDRQTGDDKPDAVIVHPAPETVCDGTYFKGCGCDRGTCYKYDTIPARNGAPYCWTQTLGTPALQGKYKQCTEHYQCNVAMTCGGNDHYTGVGVPIDHNPTTTTPITTLNPNICTGSAAQGCGCYRGTCYQYDSLPSKYMEAYCWTQKLGTPAGKGNYQKCAEASQCNRAMTCASAERNYGVADAIDHDAICDGSYTKGCGCEMGTCYKYDTIPASNGAPWCWTQKEGIAALQGQYRNCSEHYQCTQKMTCGSAERFKGAGKPIDYSPTSATTTTTTTSTQQPIPVDSTLLLPAYCLDGTYGKWKTFPATSNTPRCFTINAYGNLNFCKSHRECSSVWKCVGT